jgi:excisionase family DNA binding protein
MFITKLKATHERHRLYPTFSGRHTPSVVREEIQEGISVLRASTPTPLSHNSPSKELLTPAEASLYLKLARSTLYNMVHKRAIPHMKKARNYTLSRMSYMSGC